ncbi:hypothetical protein PILCRDRAFT_297373 [Piloderma croceum F 1598]|uniref:Uncharacterized protein n=1 Tax=Piloderma croceum (strain F 1598) TaxID=765440 RepID=A0A0C3G8T8_PILCF|nr:hypothetical protein PILCRDRAFT_297373 [Piloderma croceum F 1598]
MSMLIEEGRVEKSERALVLARVEPPERWNGIVNRMTPDDVAPLRLRPWETSMFAAYRLWSREVGNCSWTVWWTG